jgi:hypothetical protein
VFEEGGGGGSKHQRAISNKTLNSRVRPKPGNPPALQGITKTNLLQGYDGWDEIIKVSFSEILGSLIRDRGKCKISEKAPGLKPLVYLLGFWRWCMKHDSFFNTNNTPSSQKKL